MDELIQVLVFVISFLIFIVSAVRKQKKKSGAKPLKIQDEIESFFGFPVEDAIEQPKTLIEINEDKKKQQNIEAITRKNIQVNKEQTTNIKQEEAEYIDDIEEVTPGFNLRTAVIYSEILNRKTF